MKIIVEPYIINGHLVLTSAQDIEALRAMNIDTNNMHKATPEELKQHRYMSMRVTVPSNSSFEIGIVKGAA